MAQQVILDTNALIHLWNNNTTALQQMPDFKNKLLCISIFTYVEFLAPVPNRLKAPTRKFLNSFEVIAFSAASLQAAKTLSFKSQVHSSHFIDLLISANASGAKAPVYTENKKDFKRFGVKLL